MKICFVLPRTSSKAIGGYKIVYEYANRLALQGYNISILFLNTNYLKAYHIPKTFKKIYFDILNSREPKWFYLNPKVEKISDYSLDKVKRVLSEADVAVATAVRTATYVAENFKTNNKIYLIQGRENWNDSDNFVNHTYKLGMKNVVISHWLKEIVDDISKQESVIIRNPIDIEKYKVIKPIEDRKDYSLSVLYNSNPVKGFNNAFRVILKLKDRYPELEVRAFGAAPKPNYFPAWIEYTKNATQQQTIEIYNQTQVYLCSSINEGYGLTGLEAMACGCALCSTDYAAIHEYAVDKKNCLLSEVGDIEAQVRNIITLFENKEFRNNICNNAVTTVQKFSWDTALKEFKSLLK